MPARGLQKIVKPCARAAGLTFDIRRIKQKKFKRGAKDGQHITFDRVFKGSYKVTIFNKVTVKHWKLRLR